MAKSKKKASPVKKPAMILVSGDDTLLRDVRELIASARERIGATHQVTGFGADKRSVWNLPIHATEPSIVPIVPAPNGGTHGTNGTNGGAYGEFVGQMGDVEVFK